MCTSVMLGDTVPVVESTIPSDRYDHKSESPLTDYVEVICNTLWV